MKCNCGTLMMPVVNHKGHPVQFQFQTCRVDASLVQGIYLPREQVEAWCCPNCGVVQMRVDADDRFPVDPRQRSAVVCFGIFGGRSNACGLHGDKARRYAYDLREVTCPDCLKTIQVNYEGLRKEKD